ncbi:hypothetical protein [Micromonospora sp. NPDC049204]|uniref:hypothetical protein n=1 Tax=Micromonospora sp. NPDC049204 TaxID=3154351 RepID=UPI0033F501BE
MRGARPAHPSWCDRQGCEAREFHATALVPVAPAGDEQALFEVQLWQHVGSQPALALQVTDDEVTAHHLMTLRQARLLIRVLARLLVSAARTRRAAR